MSLLGVEFILMTEIINRTNGNFLFSFIHDNQDMGMSFILPVSHILSHIYHCYKNKFEGWTPFLIFEHTCNEDLTSNWTKHKWIKLCWKVMGNKPQALLFQHLHKYACRHITKWWAHTHTQNIQEWSTCISGHKLFPECFTKIAKYYSTFQCLIQRCLITIPTSFLQELLWKFLCKCLMFQRQFCFQVWYDWCS